MMPPCRVVRVAPRYPDNIQEIHNELAMEFSENLTTPNADDPDKVIMNGRKVRILQIMSSIAHFGFATNLHSVKLNEEEYQQQAVEEEEDKDVDEEMEDASAIIPPDSDILADESDGDDEPDTHLKRL